MYATLLCYVFPSVPPRPFVFVSFSRVARAYTPLRYQACIQKKVGESGDQGFGCNTFVGLGKWCARQRSLNSAGNMSVERQQRLNALDFEWDGKRIGGRSGVVKSYTKKRKNAGT